MKALPTLAFTAVVLTGMALIAPAAHLFSLPNKIRMDAPDYFIAQQIYRGWWMVGLLLPGALVANVALAVAAAHDRTVSVLAVVAAALIVVNLVIFVGWTQPANAATFNWTIQPEHWRALRQQWEYSHAINAGVIFFAFCATTIAGLRATG